MKHAVLVERWRERPILPLVTATHSIGYDNVDKDRGWRFAL